MVFLNIRAASSVPSGSPIKWDLAMLSPKHIVEERPPTSLSQLRRESPVLRNIPVSQQGVQMVVRADSPYPQLREKFLRMQIRLECEIEGVKVNGASDSLQAETHHLRRQNPTPPPKIIQKIGEPSSRLYSTTMFKPAVKKRKGDGDPMNWSKGLRRGAYVEASPKPPSEASCNAFVDRFFTRALKQRRRNDTALAERYTKRTQFLQLTKEEILQSVATLSKRTAPAPPRVPKKVS